MTTLIGFRPAFSASVVGTTSSASPNALQHTASVPVNSRASVVNWCAISISGAPPPATIARFFTKHLTTQCASCKDRSASSRTREFAPRTRSDTVRGCESFPLGVLVEVEEPVVCAGAGDERTPVTFTNREPRLLSSSTRSAEPSLSSEKDSISAIGLHPVLLQIKSISSRSISLIAMMFSFARKCKLRSFTASRKIDF